MPIRQYGLPFKLVRPTYSLDLAFRPSQLSGSKIRNFHAISRRPFVDECLVWTHTVISGLHDITGLPWAATIPLTALLTRVLVIAPFDYYGHKVFLKQRLLVPLLDEAALVAKRKVAKANPGKSVLEKEKLVRADLGRALRRLQREHGLQKWKIYLPFIRLPIWLVVMETLRRMAGTEEGMLGLIWKSFTGDRSPESRTSDVPVIPIETSLVAEGMLWFPNLLLPDPSLFLPFMLSATLYTSASFCILYRMNAYSNQSVEVAVAVRVDNKAYGLRMSRSKKVLALAAGPATLQFPSVMSLYWISSGLCFVGSKFLFRRWMPWEEAAAPTKQTPTSEKQQFRGPTMQDLRNQEQKKKQKQKQKK